MLGWRRYSVLYCEGSCLDIGMVSGSFMACSSGGDIACSSGSYEGGYGMLCRSQMEKNMVCSFEDNIARSSTEHWYACSGSMDPEGVWHAHSGHIRHS